MLLAGDIGGTKTKLAVLSPDSGLTPQAKATFKSAKFASLEAVVQEFLGESGMQVERAVFGVAGPVVGGESTATNLPWVIREAALKQTLTEGPDLIILDLMLPKLNGFEVCQRLKGDPATADIPVIILSAKGETESKVQGMNLGADDYVTKPFSPQELVARVKMILRRVYGKRPV